MAIHLDAATVLGCLGVGFSLWSFAVKRMLALRVLALVANFFFIAYGYFIEAWPGVALNLVLIPMNARRIWEIRRLTDEIAKASEFAPPSEWLLPHMQRRTAKAGEVLLRKGDEADRLIYL